MSEREPLELDIKSWDNPQGQTNIMPKALALLSQKQNEDGIIFKLLDSFRNGLIFANERSRLILWGPVLFGFGAALGCGELAGISSKIILMVLFGLIVVGAFLRYAFVGQVSKIKFAIQIFIIGAIIMALGTLTALLRTKAIEAPVLSRNLEKVQIMGTIEDIDRGYNGNWRAVVKFESVQNIEAAERPRYGRISIRELEPNHIGAKINCIAQLQPPPIAIVPGAYDFARKAWFMQIGAVGFCKSKPVFYSSEVKTLGQKILNLINSQRLKTSSLLAENKIGGGGGFLAAVFTGDRSWMSSEDTEALQSSGLHHIVSVSGMHITLIAGIVYFAFLKLLALVPWLALRFDVRKIAAFISMATALCYTIFSGAEAPAIRALFMCIVVFGAILLNRRAISMRGLAIAALLLLLLRPENAIDAGFQMSFLATMALVALWENFSHSKNFKGSNPIRRVFVWLISALLASFVAGLATMPIAVHNYGNITTYALVANLLATPISDFIVAPFSLLGVVFSIAGFSDGFFDIAKWGLDLILGISYHFSRAPIANIEVNPLNESATFLMVLCVLWLCLWRGRIRIFAIIPLLLGSTIWFLTPTPALLIAPEGRAILNLNPNNLKLCYIKGAKFDAKRLIGAAHLNKSDTAALMAQIEYPNHNKCRAAEADFEAHFINPKSLFKNAENARNTANQMPLLSLTYDDKTYAINGKTAPMGAVLVRKNGILSLDIPNNPKAPWHQQSFGNQ